MGFTKLDEGILQSSIMAERADIFKVWIALLASCDSDAIAKVSSVFLASACHLPLKVIDHAIEVLSSPDPRSRSLAEEGRRIRRVDGGYFLINYDKYRAFSYSDNPDSVRKREYRHRKDGRDILGHSGTCPGHSASASASASDSDLKSSAAITVESEFSLFWDAYPIKEGKQDALRAFKALRKTVSLETIARAFNGYMDFLKHERIKNNFDRRPKLAATLLRGDRWKEYLDFKFKAPL
jgi:hypothetical protein